MDNNHQSIKVSLHATNNKLLQQQQIEIEITTNIVFHLSLVDHTISKV